MRARQEPTYSANLPASLDGDGEDAIALAAAFFGEPMPWQRLVLRVMLARDEHDGYAASVFALSVPRQNGKSWDVRARCFYGLVCGGEKILFTCQHGDTADEMFKDLSAVFEDEDNAELHALLKAVRKTNGQQAIYLENGGYIRFTTRTNSLARGKTYDVLIYDEAQELTVAQQAASLPTISAGALGNPQTIYLGTPPDPECAGTVFRTMHDRVHGGTSTVSWMEWGATEMGDPSDEPRWYETNPSLGLRLNPGAVEDESNSMLPESFARERLGWWDSATAAADRPIDSDSWDSTSTNKKAPDGVTVFAVKLAADGSTGCLSAAVRPDEGLPHVECIRYFDASRGLTWLVEWLGQRQDDAALMVIDGTGAASALTDRPMMEAFCFRPTGTKSFGQSRITPAVRYYVDEVQRTLRYMAVSGALYATPKDVLMGLSEAQFKAMEGENFSVMATSLFKATRSKDGSVPDYRRIQAASPQPYIDSIATYAKLFSGAMGVPLNSLGIVQDNPSSAQAIEAQREDICVAAEDCIETNRESMRNVALMAMAVAENKMLDRLTDEQLSVMPDFRNPMRPSLAATADAYVKIASVLDGFAQTREFLRGQGFTPSEVARPGSGRGGGIGPGRAHPEHGQTRTAGERWRYRRRGLTGTEKTLTASVTPRIPSLTSSYAPRSPTILACRSRNSATRRSTPSIRHCTHSATRHPNSPSTCSRRLS